MTDPISRIEAALARLGAEHEPPQGWEERVIAATVDRKRSRWWWRWWLMPLPAAAVAALVLLFVRPTSTNPLLSLRSAVAGVEAHAEQAGMRRGESAGSVGDVLTARATHDGAHGALWIYRDGRLALRCPQDQGCWGFVGQTVAALKLTHQGEYLIVSLTSEREIPMPRGDYGEDVAAAKEADARDSEKRISVH